MHRSVFCSAVERTAASGALLSAASRALPAVAFSTTAPQAKLKDVSGRQGRLAAAASAVSSLGSNNAAPTTSSASGGGSSSGVKDARSLGASASGSSDGASSGEGKIINVRSLPRRSTDFSTGTRFPGGRFARAAGAAGGAAGGVSNNNRTNSNPAFQTGPRTGSGGGDGGNGSGSGGKPGRRTKGGGGGGGRMTIKRGAPNRPTADALRQQLRKKKQLATPQMQQMDDDELEWLETHAEDVATVYEPAATTADGLVAGLKGHGPAVPWSRAQSPAAAAAGVTEAVLRSMRVLAGGWAFSAGSTDVLGTEVARERLRLGQRTFFDSAAERAAVEAVLHGSRRAQQRRAQWVAATTPGTPVPSVIAAPSAATRAAIVEAAVRGVYTVPAPATAQALAGTRAAFADTAAVVESFARYHVQDHTYTAEHARRFEERARGLLQRGQAKA